VAIIYKSADLRVSAEAAWNIVERFMRAEIRVFGFIEENRIDGPLRTVVSSGSGREQPELNITVDPDLMYASYTLLKTPEWQATHHHAFMRVFDTGDGGCRFEWITDVAPDAWLSVARRKFIDGLWDDLRRVLETGEEAPRPTLSASRPRGRTSSP
jgi:hypothetical protein